jgi:hypothetical protein
MSLKIWLILGSAAVKPETSASAAASGTVANAPAERW